MDKPKMHVAVIGAGPAGLAAMKSLIEEGFQVTAFERRSNVGGVWAYSEDPGVTSVTSATRAQLSKFMIPFSDFPMPDDTPVHPAAAHLAAYYQSYAIHFGLQDKIVFGASVKAVTRTANGRQWELLIGGEDVPRVFDKIVLATGSESTPKHPVLPGIESFEGRYLHGKAYKRPQDFVGQRVLVIGQGNSAADCVVELAATAAKVFWSHRRGAMILPRVVNGKRFDKFASWKLTRMGFALAKFFPSLHRWIFHRAFSRIHWQSWGALEPEWHIDKNPFYSTNIGGMVVNDDLIPSLRKGTVLSASAIRRIQGPRSVELNDGTIIDQLDAIIACTGYSNSLDLLNDVIGYLKPHPDVRPLPGLYQGIFPVVHADSIACLNYVVIMDNAATCRELASMAVAQIWAGKSKLPPPEAMDLWIRQHQAWLVNLSLVDPLPQTEGLIEPHDWLKWVDEAAGTGIYEHFGWTVRGWKFFLREPSLYMLMAWGVNSAHIYRVFETGKRKAWPGAPQAIRHVNAQSDLDLGYTKPK